jgi:adenosine deaminase
MNEELVTHTFIEFAEQKLEEHIAELKTHYEGKVMPDKEEKESAYKKHFNMFTAELNEKFKELGEEEIVWKELEAYQQKFKNSLP